jgi:hypothetical protein
MIRVRFQTAEEQALLLVAMSNHKIVYIRPMSSIWKTKATTQRLTLCTLKLTVTI